MKMQSICRMALFLVMFVLYFEIYAGEAIFNPRSPTSGIRYSEAYGINYLYEFESGNFKYFLTTRKNSLNTRPILISKMIRICRNGKFQRPYTEIPIECKSDKSHYNLMQAVKIEKSSQQLATSLNINPNDDVLFAIFSESQTETATYDKPSNHSAICIYSVKTIDEKFTENICNYFGRNKNQGIEAVPPQCGNSEKIKSDFCSFSTDISLEDSSPIIGTPVITFDTLLTAITTKPYKTDISVFVGTNSGHLRKIVVNNMTNVCEQADIPIDEGTPVNSDLLLTNIRQPINTIDCFKHKNYNTCVHENNSKLCGWCGLTNTCTTRCDCSYSDYYAWFPNNLSEEVIVVLNGTTVVRQNETVELLLFGHSRLPAIWDSFTCEFNFENKSFYHAGEKLTRENENFYDLKCPFPNAYDVPHIPMDRNHTNGTLSISTPQISNIAKININLFDCNMRTSREECISSILPCKWYPKEKKCSRIPKIIHFFPKQGPTYGGTALTIQGEDFDNREQVNVSIGNASCLVYIFNSQEIGCITSSSPAKKAKVIVKLDGRILNFPNNTFVYIKDQDHDKNGFNINPKGIVDGGVTILIRNVNNLKTRREISFHLFDGTGVYNSSCNYFQNDSALICKSPRIPDMGNVTIDAKHPKIMKFSITDDTTCENLTIPKNQSFLLYPNPKFYYVINSSIQFDGNKFVVIHGADIDNACQVKDLLVNVGVHNCEVESISSDQVVCRLPKNSSRDMNGSQNEYDILTEVEYVDVSIGEYFNVPVPKQVANLKVGPKPNLNPDLENSPIPILICGTLIFCVIGIFLLLGYFLFRRKYFTLMQQQLNAMGMETIAVRQCIKRVVIENRINLDEKSLNILKLPNVVIEHTSTSIPKNSTKRLSQTHYILPLDDKWEFPRNKLVLGKNLGEGEFGKVVLGEALGVLPDLPSMTVAVKMLKDGTSDKDMIDLVSEMEIMKSIGTHVNILQLLGCCTQDGDLLIITEFACHGNLRDFLRSQLLSGDHKSPMGGLSVENLLTFALQIAEGMDYLAARKCIHRDLAARNVLVSEDYTMKIGDFGLARDIENKDYYRKNSDGKLPIKWMAPESLCHSTFSTQSDVWSYGILLWEIFTLGGSPYPSFMDMGKLYQALHSGYRMEKPPNCSDKMYRLMRKCWSFIPDGRPLFSKIVENLKEILSNHEDVHEFNNFEG